MADNQTRIVVESEAERTRREIAESTRQIKENPLDRTVPGGRFIGADGKAHDANGNLLEDEEESGGEDLSSLSVDELAERAKARGIEVTGSGSGGRVLKSDYVKALGG